MSKKITRNDVAQRAGVSSATVSRAYNYPDRVSLEKQNKIFTAAQDLGWEPNHHARSLRKRTSSTITLVEFSKQKRPYYWGEEPLLKWMYADIVRAALEEAGKKSFQIRLATIKTKEEAIELAQTSEGIMAYDVDTQEEAELLNSLPCPTIASHHPLNHHQNQVCTDNYEGGILQGLYLKEKGVDCPLYLIHHQDTVRPHQDRLSGFYKVFPAENVAVVHLTPDSMNRPSDLWSKKKIDGIAAVNDLTLLNLLMKSSPSPDLPMVGYDNLPVLGVLSKPFASIDLRLNKIYQTVTDKLITMILNSEHKLEKIVVPPLVAEPLLK